MASCRRHLLSLALSVFITASSSTGGITHSSTCSDTPPWTKGVCVSNSGVASVNCAQQCLSGERWDALRSALGTETVRKRRIDAGSDTVPLVRNPPWLSGTLLASAFRILAKEMLGYDEIHTLNSPSRSGIVEAADGDCRAITLEGWQSEPDLEESVLLAKDGESTAEKALAALLGAVGSQGLYVPEYTPHQAAHYKGLLSDAAALRRFPRDGTLGLSNLTHYFPESDGWGCDAEAGGWKQSLCTAGRWYPTACGQSYPSDHCAEMYLPMQAWSNGWWEAVAENNGLNFSAVYTSYDGQVDTVRRAFEEGQDILYYWWTPDPLTEMYPSQRLTLPQYSVDCGSRYAADPLVSGVDCEPEHVALRKLMNAGTAASEPDLHALWSNFEVSTAELRSLMSFHVAGGGEHENMDAAACAWLTSGDGTSPNWTAWLEISDPCSTATSGEVWDVKRSACVPVPAEENGVRDEGDGSRPTILIILALSAFVLALLLALAICVAIFRALRSGPRLSRSQPPGVGPNKTVTLVITDIQGSTSLWDAHPAEMSRAVSLHHRILRATLKDCDGYEVATEGDSFKCAFHTPEDAICWAVVVQLQLLSAPWDAVLEDGGWGEFGDREKWADVGRPKDKRNEITGYKQFKDGIMQEMDSSYIYPRKLLFGIKAATATVFSRRAVRRNPQCAVRHSSCRAAVIPAYRGLRVRVGIHTGTASVVGRHENTRRVTYGGRVAAVAKAVSEVPCGGQIVASSDTIAAIGSMDGLMQQVNELCFGWQSNEDPDGSVVPAKLTVVHLGSHIIKGAPDEGKKPPLVVLPSQQAELQVMSVRRMDGAMAACSYTFGAQGKGGSRPSGDSVQSVRDKGPGKRSSEYSKGEQFPPLAPMTTAAEEAELKSLPDLETYAEQLQRSQELVTIIPWPLRARHWCNPPPATEKVSPGYHDAPSGSCVTIIFIFIDDWEDVKQWAETSQSQAETLAESRRLFELQVRASLLACNGYEVEGEDGCFVCAFHSAVEGVEFAVALQACMTETPWSAELLTHPACAPVLSTDGKEVLCGPRLKIGLCTADAVQAQPSARTGRMEYFGWIMNHAARVAAVANGGQVLFHERTRQHLDISSLHQSVVIKYCGRHRMKGIGKSVNLYQACGPQFWEHSFPALDTKGADKALQPMLEYLTITGAERRRSSIARLSWTSFRCSASVRAEIEAEDEESGASAAKLKELVALSRRSAGVHRHISTEGMTNPERGRPKRNSIDCSFRRPAELEQFHLDAASEAKERPNSDDSIPVTHSERIIVDPSEEDGSTDLRIMKSSPTIPTSAHDGPLPWQQDDPRPQQRGGILRPSIITVGGGEGAAGKERHVKRVTLQDFSRLSIGSTSSDAKRGTEADKRGRGDERLSRSGREAMEEKERLVASTGSAMSVEDVYNHSFYALPSPVTDEATHQ